MGVIKAGGLGPRDGFKARTAAGLMAAGAHHPFDEMLARLGNGGMAGFYQVWRKVGATDYKPAKLDKDLSKADYKPAKPNKVLSKAAKKRASKRKRAENDEGRSALKIK